MVYELLDDFRIGLGSCLKTTLGVKLPSFVNVFFVSKYKRRDTPKTSTMIMLHALIYQHQQLGSKSSILICFISAKDKDQNLVTNSLQM
jgi:hypothetical protein